MNPTPTIDVVSLIQHHIELPPRAARAIHRRVRAYVDFDELVAFGNEGLVRAARQYDPSRGASFATYAWRRVHGAILDGVRKLSPLPRAVWRKLVALRAASDAQERCPARHAVHTMYLTSLDALQDEGFECASSQPEIEDRLDQARMTARARAKLALLPDRERALVAMHYWEGKDLDEAGAELGMCKSWASRLHARGLARLRRAMQDSV